MLELIVNVVNFLVFAILLFYVVVLGNRPLPKQQSEVPEWDPKFCFEPALEQVDKLVLSMHVSCGVLE